jgi:hypothetical protein
MLLRYFLNDLEMVLVGPIITSITFVFTFNLRCIYILLLLLLCRNCGLSLSTSHIIGMNMVHRRNDNDRQGTAEVLEMDAAKATSSTTNPTLTALEAKICLRGSWSLDYPRLHTGMYQMRVFYGTDFCTQN